MEAPTHRWASGVTLAAILAVGISPYLFLLPIWPHSWDATIWIVNGAPSNPDWAEWVFDTNHFKVGYRPVTALSYAADYVVGGFSALPYRLTDFLLHLGCALLTYVLYRRIAPHLPSWGGLLSAAIVLAHPVTEQVVPHLARRSYSLAAALSLAALVLVAPPASAGSPGGRRTDRVRSLFAGALFALALLANETSVVGMALLPWLALCRGGSRVEIRRRLVRVCAIPALFAVAAILLRSQVLGGLVGGYTVEVDRVSRFFPIVAASWRTLGAVSELAGPFGLVVTVALSGVSGYYLWRSASALIRPQEPPKGRLLGALSLWAGAYLLLFAVLGVWFPRQAYAVLAPVALVVGVAAADTVRLYGEDRKALVVHLIPQVFLVAWIVLQSPVVHGVDPMRAASWLRNDQLLREMHGSIAGLSSPADVRFAVPYYTRKPASGALRARANFRRPRLPARRIETWMTALESGREVSIESLLTYERHPQSPAAPPVLVGSDPPWIELPRNTVHTAGASAERFEGQGGAVRIGLRPGPRAAGVPSYLYFNDGFRGTMVRLDAERAAP